MEIVVFEEVLQYEEHIKLYLTDMNKVFLTMNSQSLNGTLIQRLGIVTQVRKVLEEFYNYRLINWIEPMSSQVSSHEQIRDAQKGKTYQLLIYSYMSLLLLLQVIKF